LPKILKLIKRLNKERSFMTKDKKFPRVILFTTPSCSYCRMAKKYLREQGVSFKDVDVSRDQAAARDMVRRSGQQGVPVLDIGGKIIVGFDRSKIDQYLGLR
jgi:glutaredoxin 3